MGRFDAQYIYVFFILNYQILTTFNLRLKGTWDFGTSDISIKTKILITRVRITIQKRSQNLGIYKLS